MQHISVGSPGVGADNFPIVITALPASSRQQQIGVSGFAVSMVVVVIVTPYIVQPSDPGQLRQPIDTVVHPSSDIEYVLQRKLGIDPLSGKNPRLVGAAGFVY